ncbi:MAG: D-2-hydroxyacid dehydrogenase [Armatimonadetes bacterium]|nr:D-2-hydroxyacid dehydrogenase [Armatimonadota bacterium]
MSGGPVVVALGAQRIPGLVALLPRALPDADLRLCAGEDEAARAIRNAEILIVSGGSGGAGALVALAPCLRWFHTTSAGVDRVLTPEVLDSPAVLTNSRGCYGRTLATHAFALIFALCRRLPLAWAQQAARRWEAHDADELGGRTLAVLGFGGVGREVAAMGRALQMRVVAADITPPGEEASHLLDAFFMIAAEGAGTPAGPGDRARMPAGFLAQADYLVICAPLTARTRGMIDEPALRAMPPGAFLINISRGPIVREEALVAALRENRIAGAGLDVFEQEPLPAEHPLWTLPNAIITPHMAWRSPHIAARLASLIGENFRRYRSGEPLLNIVDKHRGF